MTMINNVMNAVNSVVADILELDFENALEKFNMERSQDKLKKQLELLFNASSTDSTPKTATKRKPRDPNAPRAKSARQIFFDEMKAKGVSGVIKLWAEMTPEKKEKYEQERERSQAITAIQRESYTPADGKKLKTVHRGSTSAKEFYVSDAANKKRIRDMPENANINAKSVKNALSLEWDSKTAAKEDLSKWFKMAEEEKKRFDKSQERIKQLIEEERRKSTESKSPSTPSTPQPIRPKAPSPTTETETKTTIKAKNEKAAESKTIKKIANAKKKVVEKEEEDEFGTEEDLDLMINDDE